MSLLVIDGNTPGINKVHHMGATGAKGIHDRTSTQKFLLDVRLWASRYSATARRILKKVDDCETEFFILGIKNGNSAFDNDIRTIYIDLDKNHVFRPGEDGDPKNNYEKKENPPRSKPGVNGDPKNNYEKKENSPPSSPPKQLAPFVQMNPIVVFLHEIGHVVQFLDNPFQFQIYANEEVPNRPHIRNIKSAIEQEAQRKQLQRLGYQTLPGRSPKETKEQGLERQVIERKNDQVFKEWKKTYGFEKYEKLAVPFSSFLVEYDNMARHEWPICDEAKLPKREFYLALIESPTNPSLHRYDRDRKSNKGG